MIVNSCSKYFSSHVLLISDFLSASDEDQKKVEPLQVDHLMTLQRKKLQDPVTALKATVESLPTLRAISCDSMPVLTRFGDESSTAFSVSDCKWLQ